MPKYEEIRQPNPEWLEMDRRWAPITVQLGGTTAMRDAGKTWLPKEPGEEDADYKLRLDRSVLFGALADTIRKLASRPFSRPVRIKGKLPEKLEKVETNADRAGQSLHDVARRSFLDAVAFGLTHLLVDPPRVRGDEREREVLEKGIYPAIIPVSARNLIGWKLETDETGRMRLTEARILQCLGSGNPYMTSTGKKERVRVIRAGDPITGTKASWAVYEAENPDKTGEGSEWVIAKDSAGNPMAGPAEYTDIPLFTWYTGYLAPMVAEPPLDELAWQGIAHWQLSSDFRNGLRFALIFQPTATGVGEDQIKKLSKAAWNRWVYSDDAEAEFGVLEHSGKSIEAGRQAIRDIEERMELLGMKPLVERVGSSTATGVMVNEGGQLTLLQSWIRAEEAVLTAALKAEFELVSEEAPDDLAVNVFSDFHAAVAGQGDLDTLNKARDRKDIGRRRYLLELQRRGVIEEDADIDELLEEAEEEREEEAAEITARMGAGAIGTDGDPIPPAKGEDGPAGGRQAAAATGVAGGPQPGGAAGA